MAQLSLEAHLPMEADRVVLEGVGEEGLDRDMPLKNPVHGTPNFG